MCRDRPPNKRKVAAEAHTPSAIVRTLERVMDDMQSIALIPECMSPPSDRIQIRISGLVSIPRSRYL